MFAYDKTFDRKVFLGHCDLISWFSDFDVNDQYVIQNCDYLKQQSHISVKAIWRIGKNVKFNIQYTRSTSETRYKCVTHT